MASAVLLTFGLAGCATTAGQPPGVLPGSVVQCNHNAAGECDIDLRKGIPDRIEANKGNRPNYPKIRFKLHPSQGVEFANPGIVFTGAGAQLFPCPVHTRFTVLCENNGREPGGPFKYAIHFRDGTSIDPFVVNR